MKHRGGSDVDRSQNGPLSARWCDRTRLSILLSLFHETRACLFQGFLFLLSTIQLSHCHSVALRGHSDIYATLNRGDGHPVASEGSRVWGQDRPWHRPASGHWQQETNPGEGEVFFRRIITHSGDYCGGRISDLEICRSS